MKRKLVVIFIMMLFITIISSPSFGFYIEEKDILNHTKYFENLNDPPVVVIESPQDGITVNYPQITVRGYAIDYDDGLMLWGYSLLWDNLIWSKIDSITPIKTHLNFSVCQRLFDGLNQITVFAWDWQYEGSDTINITLINFNNPPDPPACVYVSTRDELSIKGYDPDGDDIRYWIDWNRDGLLDQCTVWVPSGTTQIINCNVNLGIVDVFSEDVWFALSNTTSIESKNKLFSNNPLIKIWLFERFPSIKTYFY